MKKIIILLIIVSILSICTGCSPPQSITSGTPSTSESSLKPSTESNGYSPNIPVISPEFIPTSPILLIAGIPYPEKDSMFLDEDGDWLQGEDEERMLEVVESIYNKEYCVYVDGKYVGTYAGQVRSRGLDYAFDIDIDFEGFYVAIENGYELITAALYCDAEKQVSKSTLRQIDCRFDVNVNILEKIDVDLDNDASELLLDGTFRGQESILTVCDEEKGFYANVLVDDSGGVIAYLQAFFVADLGFDTCIDKFTGAVVDIDGDGIMEVICKLNIWEGFDFTVSVYDKGYFEGYLMYDNLGI
ncbi:hypothetical protein LJC34_00275 [Oscillospiraceae bacterium OttesenSCG-928-G22]|nr:hypothetical protein [Oscillospiraceae bacterium OttesenSCG-928-G22]